MEPPYPDSIEDLLRKPWTEGGKRYLASCLNIEGVNKRCIQVSLESKGIRYTALVDTGATDSVLNTSYFRERNLPLEPTSRFDCIEVADGRKIDALGDMMWEADLITCPPPDDFPVTPRQRKARFKHRFVAVELGNTYPCILGMDWLTEYGALIDPTTKTILCRKLGNVWARNEQVDLPSLSGERQEVEEVDMETFWNEVKEVKTYLRTLRIPEPEEAISAFLGNVIIRSAKDQEEAKEVSEVKKKSKQEYNPNPDLEERAKRLQHTISTEVRQEFKDVLDGECKGVNAAMPHQHTIELKEGALPYNQKLRRLSPLESAELAKYLQELVEGGRIRPSDSPWGANVLFVAKPCGGFRCCQDYRWLNKMTKSDTYPIPRMDVYMDSATGKFWTKMDLLKGFYQMPMHPDSIKFTAFNTISGKYEFLVMHMGLQGAPGSFMRAMNKVFEGFTWDPNVARTYGVLVYLDDILLFSQTEEKHLMLLRKVLERLRKHNLQCRVDKCSFAQTEVEFIGFRLSDQGVRVDPGKLEKISEWPEVMNSKTHVRGFIGTANWMRRFVPRISEILNPLHEYAKETYRGPWTEQHSDAVRKIKAILISDEVLAVPKIDPTTKNYYPFTVISDASEIATGGILLQQQSEDKNDIKVIAYHSQKFSSAERNYSTHEKELLGVLNAIETWNCFLEGSMFRVLTDHQSLVWLNNLMEMSRRQARWVDRLQGHTFEVVYLKGVDNPADGFTRAPYHGEEEKLEIKGKPFTLINHMKGEERIHKIIQDIPSNLRIFASHTRVREYAKGTLARQLQDAYGNDRRFASPTALIREMYRDAEYTVKVNGEESDPFVPPEGVLQGDAISPELFCEYIRESIDEIERECAEMGIEFNSLPLVISIAPSFADDITGTIKLADVERFLDIVERVLARKNLQLNRGKCEIMIISNPPQAVATVAGIEVVPEVKILGLWYTADGKSYKSLEERKQRGRDKNVLHASRLNRFHCQRDLDLARLMTKVDVGPTLLFGAPIWGALGMCYQDSMDHRLQCVYSVLSRYAMGLPAGTAHWTVTIMAGLIPIQDQILMAFVRFWNKTMMVMEWNGLVNAALQQQQGMLRIRGPYWLKQWVRVWRTVLPQQGVHICLPALMMLDEQRILDALMTRNDNFLDSLGNPFHIRPCEKRKIAYTHRVMDHHRVWGEIPPYLKLHTDHHIQHTWHKLLAGHSLVAFRGYHWLSRYRFHERICDRCLSGRVGDERHVLLTCPGTQATRAQFRGSLRWCRDLPRFLHMNWGRDELVEFVHTCIESYRRAV